MPCLAAVYLTSAGLLPLAVDTSPHTQRMVAVAPGVSLEVLDSGGKGPPVVLLTGIGNTAHVYDELAPRLARDFRVFGIGIPEARSENGSETTGMDSTLRRWGDASVGRLTGPDSGGAV